MEVAAVSPPVLFAHKGNIGPGGAVGFGWLMAALAGVMTVVVLVVRVGAGRRPFPGALMGAVPFGWLALWCFGYAAACRFGADPKTSWSAVVLGVPLSLGVVLGLYRWWFGNSESNTPVS